MSKGLQVEAYTVPASLRKSSVVATHNCQVLDRPVGPPILVTVMQFSNGSVRLVETMLIGQTKDRWRCIFDPRSAATVRLSTLVDEYGEKLVTEVASKVCAEVLGEEASAGVTLGVQADYFRVQGENGVSRVFTEDTLAQENRFGVIVDTTTRRLEESRV